MAKSPRIVIAGQSVADEVEGLKIKTVAPSRWGNGYDGESLCAHQRRVSSAGYIEAEIVESNYGFSVRYASGLQNWGLIYSARGTSGTLEAALEAARQWQSMSPERRWVTCPSKYLETAQPTEN